MDSEAATGGADASAAFRAEGFAALGGFLSAGEVAGARRLAEARLALPVDAACVRPHNTLAPLRWDDALTRMVLGSQTRLRRLAEATGGDDVRWISGYVSVKEARSPPLWWHQDWWCWTHPVTFRPAAAQVALLCYLGATTAENGALRVLPGSHRRSAPIHALLPEAHGAGAHGLEPTHPALGDLPGQATLAAQPGDAFALDYRLLHGTHANATTRRRDCLVMNFAPSWRSLPLDVQGHLVQHPALPSPGEAPPPSWAALLPSFSGPRRDLPLERHAPSSFRIG